MPQFNNPLAGVRVAAPCKADWNRMMGDDRVRFCGQCSLNVYNLSAMSKYDAESLIARNEGRLCVRFYRRGDGSIITKDCPIGLRAIRRRVSFLAKAIASAVLSFMAGVGIHEVVSSSLAALPTGRTMGVMAEPIRPCATEDHPAILDQGTSTVSWAKGGYQRPPPKRNQSR